MIIIKLRIMVYENLFRIHEGYEQTVSINNEVLFT